jgi:CheY-like chemotaxis protein
MVSMALKTVLIVEDDQGIRSGLKSLFEGEGYPVLVAIHGQEALDLLEMNATSKKIGLILLDYLMPVMDGSAFLLELQRKHPKILSSIPIFMITAGSGSHRVTIKTTGILQKPFDLDELLRIATQYCGG